MSNKNSGSGDTYFSLASTQSGEAVNASASARFYIGVDGGGSGTRVLIAAHPGHLAEDVTGAAEHRVDGAGQEGQPPGQGLRAGAMPISWPLRGVAGPSGLGLGIERAWAAIEHACTEAFAAAKLDWQWSECVMACGLAGVNHVPWRDAFIASAPPLRSLSVFSDAFTTWAGALGDSTTPAAAPRPKSAAQRVCAQAAERDRRGRARARMAGDGEIIAGVVIALGTGSIGCAMDAERGWRTVGGFGFPAGDEASGAWFGLQAAGYAQRALDGRVPIDAFARALIDVMVPSDRIGKAAPALGAATAPGPSDPRTTAPGQAHHASLPDGRDRLQAWLTSANQTDYAALMRVVVDFPDHPTVRALRARAASDVDAMIDALDPGMALPVVLAGSVAPWLAGALANRHKARLRAAAGDAAAGALRVAQGWIRQPQG
ncbi:hypothetical protein [Robbsia sp. KACC 23696]|uniref:hypothetical protein n=1 Tax=Robbsia sp. KACC 23696 TaxID=3149231 RepID=UPI00325BC080